MQALARLSPDTWERIFTKRVILATGRDWKARPDSVARWNFKEASDDGWKNVGEAPPTKPAVFPSATFVHMAGQQQRRQPVPEETPVFLTACRANRPFISP